MHLLKSRRSLGASVENLAPTISGPDPETSSEQYGETSLENAIDLDEVRRILSRFEYRDFQEAQELILRARRSLAARLPRRPRPPATLLLAPHGAGRLPASPSGPHRAAGCRPDAPARGRRAADRRQPAQPLGSVREPPAIDPFIDGAMPAPAKARRLNGLTASASSATPARRRRSGTELRTPRGARTRSPGRGSPPAGGRAAPGRRRG